MERFGMLRMLGLIAPHVFSAVGVAVAVATALLTNGH